MFQYNNSAVVGVHPKYWTSRQYRWNDQWLVACYKERHAYLHLPIPAVFDRGAVTLQVRTRPYVDQRYLARTFPQWRKVTKAQMLTFYDMAVSILKTQEK